MRRLIFFWTLLATAATQAQSFRKTIPFQQSQCQTGKVKFEIFLRLEKKRSPEENDSSGAPLVFVKGTRPQVVEAITKPHPGDFSFIKPEEDSICDNTQAFEMDGGRVAILYAKDNRPFQDLDQVVLFNPRTNQILDKKEIGAVTRLFKVKNGFAFATLIPRSDVDQVTMTSTTGRKMIASDKDLGAVEVATIDNNQLKIQVDPELSFTNSPWQKYFKSKDEYLKTAGWDSEHKTFHQVVVYEATFFNRKQSDIQESCIAMVKKRGETIANSLWRCLQEKQ